MAGQKPIENTPYCYDLASEPLLSEVTRNVERLRSVGTLTPAVLKRIRDYFRLKNIYNSNAIEGNLLNYNETRLVVEEGLTISGKPLKDTLEAKNLSDALNLFEQLADRQSGPILEADIRNLHAAVLKGVNDREAGKYRDVEVAISGSKHKPPGPESVAPEMERFGGWLKLVTGPGFKPGMNPLLIACVAHTWFVSIHPFIDGNGRVSRLLLNLILMRFGYPIAVITKEDRQRYYEALGDSDRTCSLTTLLALVVESVEESLEEYLAAAKEQREQEEWARSLESKLEASQRVRAQNEYSVWQSAMELLKNQFRLTADTLNEPDEATGHRRFGFKDFGKVELERYLSLRDRRSAKKTWFFAIETIQEPRPSRYLFWVGHGTDAMQQKLGPSSVTLQVSYSDRSPRFEPIENSNDSTLPSLREVGYHAADELFCWRDRNSEIRFGRIDDAARPFFQQIAQRL